jgi:hypothetical protein
MTKDEIVSFQLTPCVCSWQRNTSIMTLSAAVLAVAVLAVAVSSAERKTVRFAGDTNLVWKVSDSTEDGTAAATLDIARTYTLTGWDELIVTGDASLLSSEPDLAYYGAGFVEGHETHASIWDYFINMDPAEDYDNYPWMDNQLTYLEGATASATASGDKFLFQVKLVLEQLYGMLDGYNAAASSSRQLQMMQLYRLNLVMNIWPNATRRTGSVAETYAGAVAGAVPPQKGRCTSLIKVTADDIFFGQSMWFGYESMTRMYKTYKFAQTVSLSGYPGVLCSCNDFYMTSHGLGVVDTSLPNYNHTAKLLHQTPNGVPPVLRSLVASHLSTSGQAWAANYAKMNTGTDDCSYFIVDTKKFTPGASSLTAGLLWVVEQIPGGVTAADMTAQLQADTFIPSFNVPFFSSVFVHGEHPRQVAAYGDWFTWDKTAVSLQFAARQAAVTGLASMKTIMRYNQYKTDNTSVMTNCSTCNPTRSALLAIGGRGDVNPSWGTYGALKEVLGPWAYGNIDVKIGSYKSMQGSSMTATIINGPVHNDVMQPFKWSTSGFTATVKHQGQPDEFNFPWITVSSGKVSSAGPSSTTAAPSSAAVFSMMLAAMSVAVTVLMA